MDHNKFAIEAKKKRIEKELKELYRIRYEMEKLASKGSECDQKNLTFVNDGITRALNGLKELELND